MFKIFKNSFKIMYVRAKPNERKKNRKGVWKFDKSENRNNLN